MAVDPRDTLRGYVRVQTAADRKVLALLRQARRDVDRQLKAIVGDGPGALVARDQAQATRAAVNARMAQLLREVGDVVKAAKLEAALEADRRMLDYDAVLMRAVADEPVVKAYLKSAGLTAETAIDLAEKRLFGAGYVKLSEQVYRTGVVTSGLLNSTINSALARGLSARDFAKEVVGFVDPNTPGGASYAAMRLARTEINNAFHARSIQEARERPWVTGMLWTLSGSHPRPDACNDYAEHDDGHGLGVYAIDDVPQKPHPQCIPAGTLVRSPSQVLAATKRWHVGGLVDVVFAEGAGELSATPNHPALTTRGWVPFSELREGDYMVGDPFDDKGDVPGGPHDQDVVARVEDVVAALDVASPVPAARVPVAAEQFHGDGGTEGHVHVVRSARLFARPVERDGLGEGPHVPLGLLQRLGGLSLDFSGLGLATDGGMSVGGDSASPLWRHDRERLSPGTHRHVLAAEHAADDGSRTVEGGRDLVERLAGRVQLHRVASVSFRERWQGHVYNLQTENGWFVANRAVISNCLCIVTEVDGNAYDNPSTGHGKTSSGGSTPQDDEDAWLDSFFAGDYDDYIDGRVTAAKAADRARTR